MKTSDVNRIDGKRESGCGGARHAARVTMAVSLALATAAACTPLSDALAVPPFRQESGGQIDLLKVEPSKNPDKAKAVYNQGIDYWNAGSRVYNAGNVKGADAYYRKAGQYWKKACDMGWADGCRGAYDFRRGQYLRHWGE